MSHVSFGIDQLLNGPAPHWKKQRIGLITNHAATTGGMVPSRQALLENGFAVKILFSPEHGLDVLGADGHRMADATDTLTGLPVVSLYSDKLAPSQEDLAGLDIVLFDVPDAGSRFYTYLWTLTHCMEACASAGVTLAVLDRPNPVSGNPGLAEGPMLHESQASFIGRWPMPVRHSCTFGELALYFNAARNIRCRLELIRCDGWDRMGFQDEWGLPFVATSPAIRSLEAMQLYPGLCLLEATNISEGRGTAHSFCCAGAPWINGEALARSLQQASIDDLEAVPVSFTPSDANSKYFGEICHGARFVITDREQFRPVYFGLLLLRMIKEMYPGNFAWKPYPTLVNPSGKQHLDKLLGIGGSENLFELPLPRFLATITRITDCREWKDIIAPFLQY